MIAIAESIKKFHLTYGQGKTIWIAFSGGLDSHVLLHLYHQLSHIYPITLHAVHINHGLHPNAQEWALHCQAICHQYQVNFVSKSLNIIHTAQTSLEEVAREKRYAALKTCMNPGELLLTAHHQDDQAETLCLQLARGAGLKGLAAMPYFFVSADIYHGRPLLLFSREMIACYAQQHNLFYLHDDSNNNIRWSRNFIRHQIFPTLKNRWPSITNTMARSAAHIAEAQQLLEEFAGEMIEKIKGSKDHTLSISQLKQYSLSKQRLILRTWIQRLSEDLPGEKKLNSIIKHVLTANIDRCPSLVFGKTIIRRYRDDLYVMPHLSIKTTFFKKAQTWKLQRPLHLPEIGILRANKVTGKGLRHDIHEVSVQFRQGGETVSVPARGRCCLKKLFQEWGVPPWLRQQIPLVFFHEQLIAVIGYFFSKQYMAQENEIGNDISLYTS